MVTVVNERNNYSVQFSSTCLLSLFLSFYGLFLYPHGFTTDKQNIYARDLFDFGNYVATAITLTNVVTWEVAYEMLHFGSLHDVVCFHF